jgi:hypothetical protein
MFGGLGDSLSNAGASISNSWDRFSNNGLPASQFSADGSTPSQFTMPGGGIPNPQPDVSGNAGVSMLPATLGGVNGMQDAQDWTKQVKDSGPGTDWSALSKLKAPDQQKQDQQRPQAMTRGQSKAVDFTPAYSMNMAQPGQSAQTNFNGLLQMLANANKGYKVI